MNFLTASLQYVYTLCRSGIVGTLRGLGRANRFGGRNEPKAINFEQARINYDRLTVKPSPVRESLEPLREEDDYFLKHAPYVYKSFEILKKNFEIKNTRGLSKLNFVSEPIDSQKLMLELKIFFKRLAADGLDYQETISTLLRIFESIEDPATPLNKDDPRLAELIQRLGGWGYKTKAGEGLVISLIDSFFRLRYKLTVERFIINHEPDVIVVCLGSAEDRFRQNGDLGCQMYPRYARDLAADKKVLVLNMYKFETQAFSVAGHDNTQIINLGSNFITDGYSTPILNQAVHQNKKLILHSFFVGSCTPLHLPWLASFYDDLPHSHKSLITILSGYYDHFDYNMHLVNAHQTAAQMLETFDTTLLPLLSANTLDGKLYSKYVSRDKRVAPLLESDWEVLPGNDKITLGVLDHRPMTVNNL